MRNLRGTYFKFCLHAGTFLTFLPKCWTRLLTGLSSLCPRCSGDKVAPGCVAAQEPLALLSSLKQTLRLFKTWAGRGWVGGADGSGVGGSCFGIAGALLVLITFSFQSFHHCIPPKLLLSSALPFILSALYHLHDLWRPSTLASSLTTRIWPLPIPIPFICCLPLIPVDSFQALFPRPCWEGRDGFHLVPCCIANTRPSSRNIADTQQTFVVVSLGSCICGVHLLKCFSFSPKSRHTSPHPPLQHVTLCLAWGQEPKQRAECVGHSGWNTPRIQFGLTPHTHTRGPETSSSLWPIAGKARVATLRLLPSPYVGHRLSHLSRSLLVLALIFFHSISELGPMFSSSRGPPTSSWESCRGQCGLKNILILAPKLWEKKWLKALECGACCFLQSILNETRNQQLQRREWKLWGTSWLQVLK